MTENDPVEVYVALDLLDAQMALASLEARGIRARVVGADLREMAGGEVGMGALSAPSIWVPAGQESEARQIVMEYEAELKKAREDPSEPWQCSSCGETVDGGFDICWNCETERGELPVGSE